MAQGLDVVARRPDEPRDQRLEARLYLAVAGGAQGGQGAAVEGSLQYHDGGLVDLALVAVQARQLDGRLVGLGAGVAKEAVVHARHATQGRAQLLLGLYAVQVGGVDQFVRLLPYGGSDRRVGVAQAVDGDAGYGVQVAASLAVIQVYTLAVTEGHRQPRIGLHQRRRHDSHSPKNAKRQRWLPIEGGNYSANARAWQSG